MESGTPFRNMVEFSRADVLVASFSVVVTETIVKIK